MTAMTPLLQLSAIGKQFGGLSALSDVSLHIQRGEIYGLIGPNGAGKTTLFNVITGLYQPSAGEFQFNGKNYKACKPHVLAQAGIARTFQNIRLFANLTALENAATCAPALACSAHCCVIAPREMKNTLLPDVRANCCVMPVSKNLCKPLPNICPMGSSGGWKLPVPWLPIRYCSHWMSPPPA